MKKETKQNNPFIYCPKYIRILKEIIKVEENSEGTNNDLSKELKND